MEASNNQRCICGNGKLYRKCYQVTKTQNTCKSFLTENLSDNVKNIQDFFDWATKEVSEAMNLLHINTASTTQRVQLIILFSFIAMMSRIWNEFTLGRDISDKNMFLWWFNKFVKTKRNVQWKAMPYIYHMKWETLYKLRCSLDHSFGIFSNCEGWQNIMIINEVSSNIVQNLKEDLLKHEKKIELIPISARDLYLLSLKAGMLMIDTMNTDQPTIEYLQWVQRTANKLEKDWAIMMKIPRSRK